MRLLLGASSLCDPANIPIYFKKEYEVAIASDCMQAFNKGGNQCLPRGTCPSTNANNPNPSPPGAQAMFQSLDANRNGTLEGNELKDFVMWVFSEMELQAGNPMTPDQKELEARKLMRLMDPENHGVTFEQLQQYFVALNQTAEDKKREAALAKQLHEYKGSSLEHKLSKRQLHHKFVQLDHHKDGRLDGEGLSQLGMWIYSHFTPHDGQDLSRDVVTREANNLSNRFPSGATYPEVENYFEELATTEHEIITSRLSRTWGKAGREDRTMQRKQQDIYHGGTQSQSMFGSMTQAVSSAYGAAADAAGMVVGGAAAAMDVVTGGAPIAPICAGPPLRCSANNGTSGMPNMDFAQRKFNELDRNNTQSLDIDEATDLARWVYETFEPRGVRLNEREA